MQFAILRNSTHHPNYCRAYLLKARIDLDGKELTEALENVDQEIAIEPNNLEAQMLKALILRALHRKKEALKMFDLSSLKLKPIAANMTAQVNC